MELVQKVLAGERLALARLLSQIENGTDTGNEALRKLFPQTGRAHLIGVTGAPGTGKSSLVNQLAYYYRHPHAGEEPKRVAIVAVDPTSPFSGGAVLGDRIRMRDLSGDHGVFIRSMASRGSLGGLAQATAGLVQAFDAAGYDVIIIETVGAGQAEVDIARLAHTTLVLEAPGLGDDIQAIKAGILEIADILVVNKADRPGVENTERALMNMLKLAHPGPKIFMRDGHHQFPAAKTAPEAPKETDEVMWIPPIERTVATKGEGIPALTEHIARHKAHLEETGEWRRREHARLQNELDLRLQRALVQQWSASAHANQYEDILARLVERELSPAEAVEQLLKSED